jgi:hypothetical protein
LQGLASDLRAAGIGRPLNEPAFHNVKLPKDKRRLNIDTTQAALQQMGYRLLMNTSQWDPFTKTTSYEVRAPSGIVQRKTGQEIRNFVYDRQG